MPGKQNGAVLLKKARDDQHLLSHMVAGGFGTEEQVGFHAQQAAEKAIKAVLEVRGVPYRFTHNLAELLDAVIDQGIDYPPEMNAAVDLTPFGSGLRYHDLPRDATGADTFDPVAAARVVDLTINWASDIVDPQGKE